MEPAEPGQPPRRRARTGRHARAVTLRAHVVAASAQARARRVGDAAGGRWHCGVLARLSGCAGARQLRLRWRLTAHGTWVLGTCCSIPFCRSRASAGLSDAAATRVGAFPAVARRAAARGDAAARYARCCRGAPPVSRASPAVRTGVGNPLLTAGRVGLLCAAPGAARRESSSAGAAVRAGGGFGARPRAVLPLPSRAARARRVARARHPYARTSALARTRSVPAACALRTFRRSRRQLCSRFTASGAADRPSTAVPHTRDNESLPAQPSRGAAQKAKHLREHAVEIYEDDDNLPGVLRVRTVLVTRRMTGSSRSSACTWT